MPTEQHKQYLQTLDRLMMKVDQGSVDSAAIMMGFSSASDYLDTRQRIFNSANNLVKEFKVTRVDNNTEQIFTDAIMQFNLQELSKSSARIEGINCYPKYQNCMGKADATLLLATVGCVATVGIPVVGPAFGVGCEAAAIYSHYLDAEKCNLDYQDCIR